MGRKKLYEGVLCSCCGNKQAVIKGMCRNCYGCIHYAEKNPTNYKPGKRGPERGETSNKAISLFKIGMKQSEIAKSLGVSRQRISYILNNRKGDVL